MNTITPEALIKRLEEANDHVIGEAKHHRAVKDAIDFIRTATEQYSLKPLWQLSDSILASGDKTLIDSYAVELRAELLKIERHGGAAQPASSAGGQKPVELLDWLEENVLDMADWIGTGEDMGAARRDEEEARKKWKQLRAAVAAPVAAEAAPIRDDEVTESPAAIYNAYTLARMRDAGWSNEQLLRRGWAVVKNEAAPQAVDLGQFRPLASFAYEMARNARGDIHLLAVQMLALIASQQKESSDAQ
jgi:hypothetical protein